MKILILGAGLMQKPAILTAKELGYTVHVVDADKNALCINLCDKFKQIDLKDKEKILEYAKEINSDGQLKAVFTAGTDFSASVSYVCEKLKLHAHSLEAALNASIKTQMRKCFLDNNIPSPIFFRCNKEQENLEALEEILKSIDFPLVVKPVDNMGGRGCRMVRTKEEFIPALQNAIKNSRSDYAIVEEYMEGPEYSIDALIYNGTFTVTGFAERHIYYKPYFIEMGHTMPAILDKETHDQLISVFALAAKSLKLSCGAAKADIKFTKKGPMIGEIAGRLSGGYMSGWTFPYSSDLNLTKQGILIASGEKPEDLLKLRKPVNFKPSKLCESMQKPYELFEIPSIRTSAERAWISIPGKVEYIENINEYTDKAVFDVLPRSTVKIGSDVDFPRNNVQKCGNIISVSHDHNIAIKASEDAVSNIFITLEPNNKKTDDFLAGNSESDEKEFPPSAFGKINEKDLEKLVGIIKKDEKIKKIVPDFMKSADYINRVDWNYNTIMQTAQKFDILRPNHKEMDSKTFWLSLFRGGIQAAVYYCDSIK